MSNYKCKVKIKSTGEIKEVYAMDNYFGRHRYGYGDGEKVYREEEIETIKNEANKNSEKELIDRIYNEGIDAQKKSIKPILKSNT